MNDEVNKILLKQTQTLLGMVLQLQKSELTPDLQVKRIIYELRKQAEIFSKGLVKWF